MPGRGHEPVDEGAHDRGEADHIRGQIVHVNGGQHLAG
jgi:hypothetical protein